MSPQFAEQLKEVLQRVRRLETRVTMYLESQGFDTQVQRPKWDADRKTVALPSRATSLKDILAVIPKDTKGEIDLEFETEVLATLVL